MLYPMIGFKAVYAGLNTESRMPVLRGTKRLLGLNLFKAFKELIKVRSENVSIVGPEDAELSFY